MKILNNRGGFILILLFVSLCSVEAYKVEVPNSTVHQYITNESQEVWVLIPYEIKQRLTGSLEASNRDHIYNRSENIINGSAEEDWFTLPVFHFWQPDNPNIVNGVAYYDDGMGSFTSSYRRALGLWIDKVIPLYLKGEINESYYWLGRVVHLLEDAAQPSHVLLDPHIGHGTGTGDSVLEEFTANTGYYNSDRNFYNYTGSDYIGKQYNYEYLIPNFDWSTVEPNNPLDKQNIELFRLFWYTAQKTQYYASDDREQNFTYTDMNNNPQNWQCNGTGNNNLWKNESLTSCSDFTNMTLLAIDDNKDNNSGPYVAQEAEAIVPHAMKSVAGLYRLFWDTVHSYDWPTFHHDNQRTGFTLLKGDMTEEADVEKIDLVLHGDVTSDSIARPSIADINNDGNMETVVATARNENEGYIYAIETKRTLLTPYTKKLKTEVRWFKNIGRNILVTPTVANIDSDSTKEVVFGLDNGTLFTLDISSGGDSASVKWTYTVDPDGGYTGELGNTAVADIDNDGINEIIVMDGKDGLPYWSGHVYVLRDNGNSATLEAKYNISNGGGWGAVSLANVDSDDNLEIIVPSYYGVYVLDYDGSTLTKKCSTTHGKLFNSVVVYDIDKDNKYELIYTTSTYGCTAPKTCYDKLYILDAETCNDESGWPKTLSYYSRTTPAIANLDSDSNLEIVISARDSTSATDYSSRILCYDANTGTEHCNYNDNGNLEAYEISPDIFDVDGDGDYNIILPDKNYELHILNNDGTKKYSVTLSGIIGSAPAVGDLDNDGKAEVAVKRKGSPINVFTTMTDFNEGPSINPIYNITAIAGSLININESGLLLAEDPDGNSLTFYYSSPFNESGLWQSTINDTGNYSILIEASDGNLSDYQYVDFMLFNSTTNVTNTFADGSTKKSLSFTGGENQTVYIRLPKNADITYARINVEGLAP